ncbi:hypothetical protein GR160_07685 [Flavobacterium sp. Sd200]|uniref:SIR2 family protein n=1 Tax=Flavobacterium sp. Sd200 TaxID=2692211 RepID=UPI00136FA5A2|nr:SIR2 family protein [Flavobacterium sp. Sd200]MXN91109.1 hypothetical protein [Flavobacterium sp. Sd200]
MLDWQSNKVNIDNLCSRLYDGNRKVICFVGAGANMQYAPSWKKLIENLLFSAIGRGIFTEEEIQSIQKVIGEDLLAIFDLIIKRADQLFISEFLEQQFSNNEGISDIYKKLIDLPFDGYITTNFDLGLSASREAAGYVNAISAVKSYQSEEYLKKWLNNEIFIHHKPILHCHGMVSIPDSVILGHKGFANIYSDDSTWKELFQYLWKNHTIVFVGFSFSDPYINVLFRHTLEPTQQHFIIQPLKSSDVSSNIANSYYLDSGLKPIFYLSKDDHNEIFDVFAQIAGCFNDKCLGEAGIAFQVELENCSHLPASVICEKLRKQYNSNFIQTVGRKKGNQFRITCSHAIFETLWTHFKQGRLTRIGDFRILSLKPSDDQIVGLEFVPDHRIIPGHPAYPKDEAVAGVFNEFLKAQYSTTFPYTDKELLDLATELAGDKAGAVVCRKEGISGMNHIIGPLNELFKPYRVSEQKKTIVYITFTPHGYYYHSNYLQPNIEYTTKVLSVLINDLPLILNCIFSTDAEYFSNNHQITLKLHDQYVHYIIDCSTIDKYEEKLKIVAAKNVHVVNGFEGLQIKLREIVNSPSYGNC